MMFIKWLLSPLTREFWVSDFPKQYADECFDCNKGRKDCNDSCQYFKKGEKNDSSNNN